MSVRHSLRIIILEVPTTGILHVVNLPLAFIIPVPHYEE